MIFFKHVVPDRPTMLYQMVQEYMDSTNSESWSYLNEEEGGGGRRRKGRGGRRREEEEEEGEEEEDNMKLWVHRKVGVGLGRVRRGVRDE